jgi:hypothetical protein
MKTSASTKTLQAEAGFYARQMRQAEANDLAAARQPGLLDEIAMLRIAMRRTMEQARDIDNLDQQVEVLRALGMAAGRLAMLVRTHVLVSGQKKSAIDALLEQALDEVLRELEGPGKALPQEGQKAISNAPASLPAHEAKPR